MGYAAVLGLGLTEPRYPSNRSSTSLFMPPTLASPQATPVRTPLLHQSSVWVAMNKTPVLWSFKKRFVSGRLCLPASHSWMLCGQLLPELALWAGEHTWSPGLTALRLPTLQLRYSSEPRPAAPGADCLLTPPFLQSSGGFCPSLCKSPLINWSSVGNSG